MILIKDYYSNRVVLRFPNRAQAQQWLNGTQELIHHKRLNAVINGERHSEVWSVFITS